MVKFNYSDCLSVSGVGEDKELVFVMEGDSVTLHTNIEANQQEKMRWYFKDFQIAAIIGEKREICTDDEYHQTGSLTITNITTTDTGDYKRKVINSGSFSDKIFNVSVHVKEGESVTLDPGVVKNLNSIKCFFNDTRIAEINGITRYICTDVQCKDGDERFRERLKLDNQTGSLTITNTRTTDSGLYQLEIINSGSDSEKIFNVTVHGESFHQCLKPGYMC
uniref:Immunoglobulin domain-containing protein n=1 Tax=Sinocyclocheilus anshuiensis TaxID=1608454 RepID=A0A671R179_9TELE